VTNLGHFFPWKILCIGWNHIFQVEIWRQFVQKNHWFQGRRFNYLHGKVIGEVRDLTRECDLFGSLKFYCIFSFTFLIFFHLSLVTFLLLFGLSFELLSLLLPYCPKGGAVLCRLFLGHEGIMKGTWVTQGSPEICWLCVHGKYDYRNIVFGRRQKVAHRHHESQGKHDYSHHKRHLERGSFLICKFLDQIYRDISDNFHFAKFMSLPLTSHFEKSP
jgi:hypothetical protein